ncbi:MAG: Type 1 glutamine amidotransferase-like domain-containing protein [Thermoanaerobaculia bacterium]
MNPLTLSPAVSFQLLVLIGGGEFSFGETREVDEFLVSRMPADRRKVAFLPTASGSPEYAQHIGRYFQQIDPAIETINVPVYRGRDNRRPKNLQLLLSGGMIYLGGGVTNNLLATLRQSPAELAIRDAAANGAVIAAIGAAASCFGAHARDMQGGGALEGLGWLRATAIDTAFDPENDTALRRLMSLPDVDLGIGIPPKTALVIEGDGSTRVIGAESIAVFRKR